MDSGYSVQTRFIFEDNYLCLCVCLSDSEVTQKVVDISKKFSGMVGRATTGDG